jgi:hypothetical protein
MTLTGKFFQVSLVLPRQPLAAMIISHLQLSRPDLVQPCPYELPVRYRSIKEAEKAAWVLARTLRAAHCNVRTSVQPTAISVIMELDFPIGTETDKKCVAIRITSKAISSQVKPARFVLPHFTINDHGKDVQALKVGLSLAFGIESIIDSVDFGKYVELRVRI